MSAEQYGAGLLAGVQKESLDELLRNVRLSIEPQPKGVLGLRWLDELLELFRYHGQTPSARRAAWPADEDGIESLNDEHESPTRAVAIAKKPRSPIIEVTGSHLAAGKTSFLYLITAHALLPVSSGGKGSVAVWIDADGRFSIMRLVQIMQHIMPKDDPRLSSDSAIHSALSSLYILTPSSSSQLLSDLQSLPNTLLITTSSRPLSLLILDSATAFTAQDRFDADIARLEAGPEFSSRPQTPTRTAQIIAMLHNIQQTFDCAIAFSSNTPSLTPTSAVRPITAPSHNASPPPPNNPARPHPQEPAPISPWTVFALLTLRASRIPVTQFAPSATSEECLRDREKRQAAVAAGRFSVALDWGGSDRWPVRVREAVERLEERGRAEMRVVEGCVDLL